MRRPGKALLDFLIRFWENEGNFTVLLTGMVLTVFVFVPLSMESPGWRLLVDICTATLTIAGAYAAWKQDVARPLTLTLAISSFLALVVGRYVLHESFALLSTALFGLYMLLLTLVVLARVFQPGAVTRQKIEAAMAAYILIGLTAGFTFEFIERLCPNAYHLQQDSIAVDVLRPQLIYFSYSTLTSVGYGDIVPTIPLTRSLASLEAIIGQFYIAILVGGLVSQHLSAMAAAERRARREASLQDAAPRRKQPRRSGAGDREKSDARPKERGHRLPPPAIPHETDGSR